jgi:hypothetical protein
MIYTPFSLEDYKVRYLLSPGRQGLPMHLVALTLESKTLSIKRLISELNKKQVARLDPDPNFSRSFSRPAMFCALRDGAIEKALFVGGSNTGKLAAATSMLGLDVFKLASGGWKFSQEAVDALFSSFLRFSASSSLPAAVRQATCPTSMNRTM